MVLGKQVMTEVKVEKKRIDDYKPVVGDQVIEELKDLSKNLKRKRVLHINSTSFGGGVAEILYTLVPLLQDLGLDTHWMVIKGDDEFFNVTKAFHNALQGMDMNLTPEMKEIYIKYNKMNAEGFEGEYDFIFIHDPQPAYMINFLPRKSAKFINRIHIDLTNANQKFWNFLKPALDKFDAAIFTMKQYVKKDLNVPHIYIMPPCIDPLSPKNIPLPLDKAKEIMKKYGVDTDRPVLLQVSRFDPWKDPLGVIDAYRIVKKEVPEVQLVLLGSMATDDPEGWDYYEKTARHAGEDYDIYLLHNLKGCGALEVNAFQVASDVVIQKSIREGFGLVVTEALWKGKPVVAGNVGGIPMQVIDGKTGFLVNTIEECAEKSLYLLKNPHQREELGKNAKEHVRQNFLTTRNVKDYLKLMNDLL